MHIYAREQVEQSLAFYEITDLRPHRRLLASGSSRYLLKHAMCLIAVLLYWTFFLSSEKNSLIPLLFASNVTLNTHRLTVLIIEYSITVNTQHKSPEKPWQCLSKPSVRVLREFRSCTGQHSDGIFSNASMV